MLTLLQSKRRRTATKTSGGAVDSDSDDQPLLQKAKDKRPPRITEAQIGESSDSDAPIEQKLAAEKDRIQAKAAKEAVAIRKEQKKAAPAPPAKKKSKGKDDGKEAVNSAKARRVSAPKKADTKRRTG